VVAIRQRAFQLVFAVGLAIAPGAGRADLVEADLFVPGDGLLLHDTWTGLLWLDLTETVGESFVSVSNGFGGFTSTEGFRYATGAEVTELYYSSAGIYSGSFSPLNRPGVEFLLDAMGCTSSCGTGSDLARGVTSQVPVVGHHRSGFVELHPNGTDARANPESGSFDDTQGDPSRGSYLVRYKVPKPLPPRRVILDATGDGTGNTLLGPLGVAADPFGNVFVSGGESHNVFKIEPGGLITEILDATGDGAGNPLTSPWGIATDADGNVFVCGVDSDNVFKITPAGVISVILDATGDGAANPMTAPRHVAVDAAGNVYVFASGMVFQVTPAGVVQRLNGPIIFGPGSLAVEPGGTVYVSSPFTQQLLRIEPGGALTELYLAHGAPLGESPIAVDGSGSVRLADLGGGPGPGNFNAQVIELTPPSGIELLMDYGGDGAGNTFAGPNAIDLDAVGNVYVSTPFDGNPESGNVFQIAPDGEVWMIIDHAGDGTTPLSRASWIAAGVGGHVYVSDSFGSRVFEIELPVAAVPALSGPLLAGLAAAMLAITLSSRLGRRMR